MMVTLLRYPTEQDLVEVKSRALITMYGKGLGRVNMPTEEWKRRDVCLMYQSL